MKRTSSSLNAALAGVLSLFLPQACVHAQNTPASHDAVVELRQYLLKPDQREVLIELFDREFVETQEAVGMTIVGQFRDLDRPDYFVWLRGFPDMSARAASLGAFYGGPVWKAHGKAAASTMIDSDNVLLLEPAGSRKTLALPARSSPNSPAGVIVATIHYVKEEAAGGFPEFFEKALQPAMAAAGAVVVAAYRTSLNPNNFPRLPVREGERAFVWLARFESENAYDMYQSALAANPDWQTRLRPALNSRLAKPSDTLRLAPTSRSRLR